ncbi:MAG: DUF2322 family protein [Thiotrichales bacterium]
MPSFADNLARLPDVSQIQRLELYRADAGSVAIIENKPGSAGSVAVYLHLMRKHGVITVLAAREGLELYAEHTADAHAHPGKHPNIDQLIQVIADGIGLSVEPIRRPPQ